MTATASLTAASPLSRVCKLGNIKKGLGLGSIGTALTAAFCLYDFADVPKTFNSKYDSSANQVDGKNWSGAFKEVLKSIPKCASCFVLPALIGTATMCASPLVATLGGLAAFVSPILAYQLWDKIFPHESELIAKACEEKGISLSPQENPASMNQLA